MARKRVDPSDPEAELGVYMAPADHARLLAIREQQSGVVFPKRAATTHDVSVRILRSCVGAGGLLHEAGEVLDLDAVTAKQLIAWRKAEAA